MLEAWGRGLFGAIVAASLSACGGPGAEAVTGRVVDVSAGVQSSAPSVAVAVEFENMASMPVRVSRYRIVWTEAPAEFRPETPIPPGTSRRTVSMLGVTFNPDSSRALMSARVEVE
jgi:hypothetical protein